MNDQNKLNRKTANTFISNPLLTSSANSTSVDPLSTHTISSSHDLSRISFRPQAKLSVSQPGDAYEQEADKVAQEVMGMGDLSLQQERTPHAEHNLQRKPVGAFITPLIQRSEISEEEEEEETLQMKSIGNFAIQREELPEEEEEELVQAKYLLQRVGDSDLAAGNDISSKLHSRQGGGSPLADSVRSFMEPRFRVDFSHVKVHSDGEAVQMVRDVGAQAFAYGNDVYFGAGKSPGNDELTAHELTHVVQQTGEVQKSVLQKSPLSIQRDLTEDQKKSWKDLNGDQFVSQIKASVEEWKKFRSTPESFEQLPKAGNAPSELAEFLRTSDPMYKQYAAEKIGSDNVAYISEMAAFIPRFRLLIGMIPGVAYVDPAHSYKMTANTELTGLVPMEIPLSHLNVEYSNGFGWHWSKVLIGSQIKWKVGVSSGDIKDKGKDKGVAMPKPADISVNTEAIATSVPYWGYKDLAGVVTVVNGPSVKGTMGGFGPKAVSGGIIQLAGTGTAPGTLAFMNTISKIKLAKPENLKGVRKGVEISLTLIEGGVGVAIGGNQSVATPELAPEPVPEEKIWRYVVSGFETGSPDIKIPEDEVHPIIEMIRKDIEDKKKNIESIKPYLKKTGINQEFKLDFYSEGYASRLWTGAGNNKQVRLQKNIELSKQRAQNVTSMLNTAFGSEHIYAFDGKGAAVYLPQPDTQFGKVLPENGNEQIIEQRIRELAEQYMDKDSNLSPAEAHRIAEQNRKIIEANLGENSNVPLTRRVNITITWHGFNIKWGANSSPVPKQVN
jgi:Domain of unknown function (DUF4157)